MNQGGCQGQNTVCRCTAEAFIEGLGKTLKREIPAYHFTHGGLLLNGCVLTMFYFADVQMGMLAVAMSITGPTKFLRFSGKLLSPNLVASDN